MMSKKKNKKWQHWNDEEIDYNITVTVIVIAIVIIIVMNSNNHVKAGGPEPTVYVNFLVTFETYFSEVTKRYRLESL